MIISLGLIITSDMVAERHYFFEILHEPLILWGLRGICIITALSVFLIYVKMRKEDRK
ncbi:hypothetical protein [Acetobacterium malicum]|uniref:hypothetical protein n=1 Tax=Acetobacterium malicum TaxID=52692 RepID=UPI0012EBE7F4|nr:hypothetical protein [Acetobacterium dehalogenans]